MRNNSQKDNIFRMYLSIQKNEESTIESQSTTQILIRRVSSFY